MFNLEQAIKNWKRRLRSNPAFEDGDIAELESHLREEIERLKGEGLSKEEAFQQAADEIGEPEPIGNELYKSRATQKGGPVPPWKQQSWVPIALPSYFLVAIRKFRNNPVFSMVNVLGLSVALSVCLLVISFTNNQAGYDAFHEKADRIYRVNTSLSPAGGATTERYASSPFRFGAILENSIPGITEIVRLKPFSGAVLFDETRLRVNGFQTDSTFFKLFDFDLISGNVDKVLSSPNSIVLTETTAERFFGNQNPVGETLTLQDGEHHQVTGIVSRRNMRSHLEFEVLIPIHSLQTVSELQDWENPIWYTYLLLEDQIDPGELESRFPTLVQSFNPSERKSEYEITLQPLKKINLGPLLAREIGRITPVEFVYFLFALALVVMFAAGINYVNLTVARSLQRTKEIGMRKIIGAGRLQLVGQFLSESVVVAFISLGIGLFIFWGWLLPYWNSMRLATADFGQILFNFSRDVDVLLLFAGFTLLVGLCAGMYPALKLSSLSPLKALKKSSVKDHLSGWSPGKFLVVFQVALSVVLMVSTLLLYRQANLLLNTDYGFRHSNVINVELGDIPYEAFKKAVASRAGVAGISAISKLPGVHFPDRVWVKTSPKPDSINAAVYSADESMMDILELNLVAGRNFLPANETGPGRGVIINELAAQRLGYDSPAEALGNFIEPGNIGSALQIVGIVENLHFDFLWKPDSPLIIWNNPSAFNIASIQMSSGNHEQVLEDIKNVWQNFEPVAPFDYQYYSHQIENVYADFKELADVISFLAAIAILIACMGLLAMAHYDTQSRIKEIGVRKVLGATVQDLVLLLSSGFSKIVGIALLFAIPATIYLNKLWLQIFANRIELTAGVIGLGVMAVILLASLSIGWQTIRAALKNPIHNLRSE